MRCDKCGREIHSGETSLLTTVEKPDFSMVANPGYTRAVSLTLCEACTASRNSTQRLFIWAIALVVGGMIAGAILIQVFA
jgi:hypothetical protein